MLLSWKYSTVCNSVFAHIDYYRHLVQTAMPKNYKRGERNEIKLFTYGSGSIAAAALHSLLLDVVDQIRLLYVVCLDIMV